MQGGLPGTQKARIKPTHANRVSSDPIFVPKH